MKTYIGKKTVKADQMTMGEAYERNLLKAGRIPSEEEKKMAGYLVEYEGGYQSWSPASVFRKAYRLADNFLDRLYIERDELKERYDKLETFLSSDKFLQLDVKTRSLMQLQHSAMKWYLDCLNSRITDFVCKTNGSSTL